MATWPVSLPQKPKHATLGVTRERAVREFAPDVGRPIRSPRQSIAHELLTAVYEFTPDQHDDFWDFWETDIGMGKLTFTMPHPKTGAAVTVELTDTEPPQMQYVFKDTYAATLKIRVLP